MRDVDLALSELADIRAQLAASTRFQGLAPELNLLMGIAAFVVAAARRVAKSCQCCGTS